MPIKKRAVTVTHHGILVVVEQYVNSLRKITIYEGLLEGAFARGSRIGWTLAFRNAVLSPMPPQGEDHLIRRIPGISLYHVILPIQPLPYCQRQMSDVLHTLPARASQTHQRGWTHLNV